MTNLGLYHSFLASAVFKMNELLRAMFLRDSLLLLCYAVENNNKFNSKFNSSAMMHRYVNFGTVFAVLSQQL